MLLGRLAILSRVAPEDALKLALMAGLTEVLLDAEVAKDVLANAAYPGVHH